MTTNCLTDSVPGAATMAHPAMIAACRVAYRAAAVVGEPVLAKAVRRAWGCGNAARVEEHLDTLGELVALLDGYDQLAKAVAEARAALAPLIAPARVGFCVAARKEPPMATNTSPANALRAALKAEGFNARRVTVRHEHSTMHSSLHVTIRDGWASLSKVKAIASRFESVSRCSVTGEILGGGNTYVDVEYSDDLVQPAKAAILVILDPAPHDEWVTVLGDFRALKVSGWRDDVRIEGPGFDHRNGMAAGVGWAAERIAIAFLDVSAAAAGVGIEGGAAQRVSLPG